MTQTKAAAVITAAASLRISHRPPLLLLPLLRRRRLSLLQTFLPTSRTFSSLQISSLKLMLSSNGPHKLRSLRRNCSSHSKMTQNSDRSGHGRGSHLQRGYAIPRHNGVVE